MKKLFFLTALLCASVMANAAKICDFATGHQSDPNFGDPNGRILLTIEPTENANEFILTIKPNYANGATKKLDYLYVIAGGNSPYPAQAGADEGEDSYDELSVTFTNSSATTSFTIQWSNPDWTGRWECALSVDLAKLKSCADTGLDDPELALNQTEVTLSAAATPVDSFQIVALKAEGAGAVSYESSNAGIASVSNTGLIKAVGRGTAIITVTVAETATHEGDEKTVTVTVTGPINWDAIGWLANSNEKYKLVIDPDFSNDFGGKRIEGSNLWVGFPSADFGACSIEMSNNEGAWRTFALSQFSQTNNEFTVVNGGTTYNFTVYNADGTDTETAIINTEANVKAVKVIENGQLIIVKNGVKYNALGTEVR